MGLFIIEEFSTREGRALIAIAALLSTSLYFILDYRDSTLIKDVTLNASKAQHESLKTKHPILITPAPSQSSCFKSNPEPNTFKYYVAAKNSSISDDKAYWACVSFSHKCPAMRIEMNGGVFIAKNINEKTRDYSYQDIQNCARIAEIDSLADFTNTPQSLKKQKETDNTDSWLP
jgi:hypothetical protein